MRSRELEELLGQSERVRRILWIALTATIVVYLAVAYAVAGEPRPLAPGLEMALAFASMGVAAFSLATPRVLLSDERLDRYLAEEPSSSPLATRPRTGQVDPVLLARVERLPAAERRLLGLAQLFFVPFVVRLVLNESIAMLGLVIALVSSQPGRMLPYAGAAIVLNLLTSPSLDPLLERAASRTRS
jgi:hypothetical protein